MPTYAISLGSIRKTGTPYKMKTKGNCMLPLQYHTLVDYDKMRKTPSLVTIAAVKENDTL